MRERLEYFESRPEMLKLAICQEDIEAYNLPPDFTKVTDTRQDGFVHKYDDQAVELDVFPVDILRDRIRDGVERYLDMNALREVRALEEDEKKRLGKCLARRDRGVEYVNRSSLFAAVQTNYYKIISN